MNSTNLSPHTVQEVAFDAVFKGNIKSLVQFLSWFDSRKLSLALRRLRYRRKKSGHQHMAKIEEYADSLFMISAKITWDDKGRHIQLIRANKAVGYITNYYFRSKTISPSLKGKIKKVVRRVRNRVFQRLYQMPEEKLQQFLASREEKIEG